MIKLSYKICYKGEKMKKTQNKKVIKPVNPVNVFVILVILLTLTATIIMVLNNQYGFDGKKKPVISDYEIKVIIKTEEIDNYGQYANFTLGKEFIISENNTVLGTVIQEPVYAGNVNGFFVVLKARGTYDYENGFMLNGNMYLAPNTNLKINGEDSIHRAEIYSIEMIK